MSYCTRCGKQIQEAETCSCVANSQDGIQDRIQEVGVAAFSAIKQATTTFGAQAAASYSEVDMSSGSDFFRTLKNRLGIGDPEKNGTSCYERGQRIVPDSVSPNEGEIPVRQYDIAVLRTKIRFERAEGRLQITNKRVIFRATGRSLTGRIALQYEFAIDQIAGIEARRVYRMSPFNFVLGLIAVINIVLSFGGVSVFLGLGWDYLLEMNLNPAGFVVLGIAGLVPFFTLHKKFLIKLLALAISTGSFLGFGTIILAIIAGVLTAFCLMIFSLYPNLVLSFKTNGGTPATDLRRNYSSDKQSRADGSTMFSGSSGFQEVLATPETDRAIRELGAIISDIQKLGDFGVQKWVQ